MTSFFQRFTERNHGAPLMKINLLGAHADAEIRKKTIRIAISFTIFVGFLASIGAGASYRSATKGTAIIDEVGNFFVFTELRKLWGSPSATPTTDPLSTPDHRFNVLLLGIGGEGHDGALLTDTILLAEYDSTEERLALVSIPRDLAYPLGNDRFEKINAVHAYAEQTTPGQGASKTAEAFSTFFNLRIDRVIRVDFQGFEKLVNALGGIDVTIEKSFSDTSFPTDDTGPDPYKWTSVTFTKGTEHMDGPRALTYVRSRHGTNGEGSDFARSRRQQIVMNAIRDRLLELGTLSNPRTLSNVWSAISDHVQTDLSPWDMLKLVPAAIHFQPSKLTQRVLTDAPNGELNDVTIGGAFMLFPKKSDYSQIKEIIANPWNVTGTTAEVAKPSAPTIRIAVQNGTIRTGFAATIAESLKKLGYTIMSTGNAPKRGITTTVIYDLTNGQKVNELVNLKKTLNANIGSAPLSELGTTVPSGTQFLIILGESSIE